MEIVEIVDLRRKVKVVKKQGREDYVEGLPEACDNCKYKREHYPYCEKNYFEEPVFSSYGGCKHHRPLKLLVVSKKVKETLKELPRKDLVTIS